MLYVIDKTYSIDNYKITNCFDMLDHLLTNTNYTATQTKKPKGQ